jgi:hypothetical protein
MPVVQSNLIRAGRTGNFDAHGNNRYTAVYRVVSSDPANGPLNVVVNGQLAGSPDRLPTIYEPYAFASEGIDFSAVALSMDCELEHGDLAAKIWLVTVHYGPRGQFRLSDIEPPIYRDPIYRIETNTYSRIVERDIDGGAIANAIGEPFDPPVEEEWMAPVLTVTKYFGSLAECEAIMTEYADAVNLDEWHGAAPRQCKMIRFSSSQEQSEHNQTFYALTMSIEFKRQGETWDVTRPNEGWGYWDAADTKVLQTTVGDQPITAPVALDADGTLRAAGQPKDTLTFRTRPEKVFANLNI